MRMSSGLFMCSYASSMTRCDSVAENIMVSRSVRMRHAPQYEADVLDKAEIEHTICLIQ